MAATADEKVEVVIIERQSLQTAVARTMDVTGRIESMSSVRSELREVKLETEFLIGSLQKFDFSIFVE